MAQDEIVKIHFRIVTDEYDYIEVKRQLQLLIENNDFYARDLKNRIPDLVVTFKDKCVYDNPEFIADVLIIDDEIQCIIQYFKTLEQFSKEEGYTLLNVVACTKSMASHVVFDCISDNTTNLLKNGIRNVDPKLVFLDFDLREPNNDNSIVLTSLVNKIHALWEQFDTEIVGVSAFAFTNDQRFSPFQQWLREGLISTFPKDPDLWDMKRMRVHYSNNLMRHRKILPELEVFRKESEKQLERLHQKHEKKKLDSTVMLLDAIEAAISQIELSQKEVSLDALAVLNKDGTIYKKDAFEVEVGKKCDIIADLINNRNSIIKFKSRWDRFIHHVKAGTLFAKRLRSQILM